MPTASSAARLAIDRLAGHPGSGRAKFDDKAPACSFTTFVAYEHTNTPQLTKIHRNVIFRNDKVPELPITAADEPDPLRLWQALEQECKQGIPGCDVLAIPHNPNLSNGQIFTIEYPEGATLEEQARTRRSGRAWSPSPR